MTKIRNKKVIKSSKKKVQIFEVPVKIDADTFYALKTMAKAECRSISQQIKFLMLLGRDLVLNSSGIVTRGTTDNKSENSELESAIGFKIGD